MVVQGSKAAMVEGNETWLVEAGQRSVDDDAEAVAVAVGKFFCIPS
jgi:hypothetical protein